MMKEKCYCDSGQPFDLCCGPILARQNKAGSSLALMRSRFSAFSLGNIDYLKDTMSKPFSESTLHPYQWVKLEILSQIDLNHVEFKAYFIHRDKLHVLHEHSEFELIDGNWIYTKGQLFNTENPNRLITLNSPCPCESGKKYKNCHRVKST